MKIALVYDLIYPFSIGGVESRNFSLAKELVLKGHEVHLFGAKMWKGDQTIKISKKLFIHGITSYSGKYKFSGKRKMLEPLKYSILLLRELFRHDFDVIDATAFPYLHVFSCMLYSSIKKKPLIITWHEVWDEYWKNFGIIGAFGNIIEKICAKMSKHNICVSKLTALRLEKIGAGNRSVEIITNWIDFEEIDKELPLKESCDLISVGRHMKHKNFDLFLRVCAVLRSKMPGLKALIIGEGPETVNLLKMRKALGLEDCVEIICFAKDRALMLRYMKSSKIFVLLSELEGFSIVSAEAMACGLPVITIKDKKNATAEFIEDGINGFICDKNEIEIISKISSLLKNAKLLERVSKNSKRYARQFSHSEKICAVLKYYKRSKKHY